MEENRDKQNPSCVANYLEMYWFGLVPRKQNLTEPFALGACYHVISNLVLKLTELLIAVVITALEMPTSEHDVTEDFVVNYIWKS